MPFHYDKIVIFGDSITQYAYKQDVGFCVGAALQNLYTRRLDVVQRGYGGYNSDHGTVLIDTIIEQETTPTSKIKLLIVFFGTNDCVIPSVWKQHVPIARYKSNLRRFASAAAAAGIKVIFIGAGPFDEHKYLVGQEDRKGFRSTLLARAYCDAAVEVGKELNVPVVPLWYAIMADAGWKQGDPCYGLLDVTPDHPLGHYLTDGLHFTGRAYEIEFKGILEAIRQFYPDLQAESIPLRLPLLDDITSLECLENALV